MYQRILIPVDGSACSDQAAQYGFALARTLDTPVTLCHVVSSHGLAEDDEHQRIEHQHGHGLLEHWQHTAEHAGLKARVHLMTGDRIAELIIEATRLENSDLIVMGTHGRSNIGRLLLGSVAERVLRLAHTPVLIVKPDPSRAGMEPRFDHLLVPVDGSPISNLALDHAIALSRKFGARLELLHVVREVPTPWVEPAGFIAPDRLRSELERDGKIILETAQAQARSGGIEAQIILAHAKGMSIGEVIARTAREHHTHLMVMGTHGHTGLERLLLGSVASWVSHRADGPVLLVRPTA
jgi:nucleotide-binding universal stress UspA family protein